MQLVNKIIWIILNQIMLKYCKWLQSKPFYGGICSAQMETVLSIGKLNGDYFRPTTEYCNSSLR